MPQCVTLKGARNYLIFTAPRVVMVSVSGKLKQQTERCLAESKSVLIAVRIIKLNRLACLQESVAPGP